ncbi:hypothetical protein OUZ56_016303 [Daphnia magna]|uniref:CCHC-type domain-containing protein n=1 Tax=Daphnia magna TaxID=35525 RepID=A0ABR0AQ93_9CRUS|nr:hypothetical protein OUZ56_016303 [Daphnia magna]
MIDDVITGGPKLLRSPINTPIFPKTTAIPDQFQGGKASEKTIEAVKKSASPIFKPKVKQDDTQLKKLRTNVAYVAVPGLDNINSRKPRAKNITKRKNTTNGKTVDTESSPPIPRDHDESGEDFPDSDEQVAIPNTSHQEPEGERSGFPVERPEDPDPTNLVAKGHPIDISLSEQPADNGVEETNVSSEIFDGDSRGETHHTDEEDEENGTAGVRTNGNFHDICEAVSDLPLRTDLQHHRLNETHSNEKQDRLYYISESADHGKRLTYAIGTTDPGDKITSDKTGQLPSSHQTKQRAVDGEHQTNANPNQNKLETIVTIEYHKPTEPSTTAVETQTTSEAITKQRLTSHPAITQSVPKSTTPFLGTEVVSATNNFRESGTIPVSVPELVQNPKKRSLTSQFPNPNSKMAYSLSHTRAATVKDLDDFQNNQHTFSRLQLLPSFSGSPITRFDSWLESFESIVDGSGWSNEKIIQMLRAKFTDRAFSVIQAILKENPDDYASIKESLLDHFHGDENADLYLKKFNKAKRKPGEKIVDYAHRLQEIFKRAYPMGYGEKSFTVILIQKFIEGLDSKLQSKVKYKEFKDFNDLVASTRVYALRLEALETDRDKNEFIRKIDGSYESKDAELKEIKQIIIDQKELMTNAVANIRLGNRQVEEPKNKSDEIKNVLHELTQAVKKLQFDAKDGVSYTPNTPFRKQVSFQTPTFNREKNWNYSPSRFGSNDNNTQQFSRFPNKPRNFTSSFSKPSSDSPYRPSQPLMTCNFCGFRGHTQSTCRKFQRQNLEQAQPPICYSCREIGHKSNNCPKIREPNRPNIPGPPQRQGNH